MLALGWAGLLAMFTFSLAMGWTRAATATAASASRVGVQIVNGRSHLIQFCSRLVRAKLRLSLGGSAMEASASRILATVALALMVIVTGAHKGTIAGNKTFVLCFLNC